MDSERTMNIRQRVNNLTPDSPMTAWKNALDAFIDAVRSESLESGITESEEQRQARRIAITEAKTTLLDLLKSPQELWQRYEDEKEFKKFDDVG